MNSKEKRLAEAWQRRDKKIEFFGQEIKRLKIRAQKARKAARAAKRGG